MAAVDSASSEVGSRYYGSVFGSPLALYSTCSNFAKNIMQQNCVIIAEWKVTSQGIARIQGSKAKTDKKLIKLEHNTGTAGW